MNVHTITGNVGKDPELKYTQSGKAIAAFSVAVADGYGDKKTTHWISCIAWEKTAEFCVKYLQKGSKVLVTGKGTINSWEKDGQKHSRYELVVQAVEPFVWKEQAQETPAPAAPAQEQKPFAEQSPAFADDDIPF